MGTRIQNYNGAILSYSNSANAMQITPNKMQDIFQSKFTKFPNSRLFLHNSWRGKAGARGNCCTLSRNENLKFVPQCPNAPGEFSSPSPHSIPRTSLRPFVVWVAERQRTTIWLKSSSPAGLGFPGGFS